MPQKIEFPVETVRLNLAVNNVGFTLTRQTFEKSRPLIGISIFIVVVSLWCAARTTGWQSVIVSFVFDAITFFLGFYTGWGVKVITHRE
jgi:hypothetical protein